MNKKEIYLILRRRKNISQIELSKELNCSQSLISRYEKNECEMSEYKIKKYKQYIDQK
ncbi:helix-turn-helix domain-containing protein [Oceanobacillus massiliensis]|uniref:helix-turn-helix domain-containing protein n=1 Tax=Oceanobacillus massiliensis TaxID=1465765 RepID=UPI0002895760|nr:helix-turn-helix transcriptional regulator [Oceanobacillus massiliensis]